MGPKLKLVSLCPIVAFGRKWGSFFGTKNPFFWHMGRSFPSAWGPFWHLRIYCATFCFRVKPVFARGPVRRAKKSSPTPLGGHRLPVTALALSARRPFKSWIKCRTATLQVNAKPVFTASTGRIAPLSRRNRRTWQPWQPCHRNGLLSFQSTPSSTVRKMGSAVSL